MAVTHRTRGIMFLLAAWCLAASFASPSLRAQEAPLDRLSALQAEIIAQQQSIERLQQELEATQREFALPHSPATRLSSLPAIAPESSLAGIEHGENCACATHFVGYDKGFFIRPYCPEQTPFEIVVNGRIQFRHTAFDRQADTYFDRAAGINRVIEPRNDFEIERGRLAFSGFVHDPNLKFFLNLDLDTDDAHRAVAHDFWFSYRFSERITIYAGKAFVPGSRSWLDGALNLQLGDRSMSTTFFRPDRSVGLWAIGTLSEKWHYRVMLGNGFRAADLRDTTLDNQWMVAGSTWWEPWAKLGSGYSDLQFHEDLAVRVGASATYAANDSDANGNTISEQRFVRLSDGVRLIDTGALAPGVTVNHFTVTLLAADLAAKYRGWSMNAEFYARWLGNFGASGPVPFDSLYTDGFYFDTGYMLCPEKLEVAGRVSTVDGFFGDAWEYAAGINVFFNGHKNKLTFDATYLDGSPTANSGTNHRVGDRGVLFRSAWQVAF